jgi:tripartite ATP-independent transporter DctM subunit
MSVTEITSIVVISLMIALALGIPVAFCLFGLALLFDLIFLGPGSLYMSFTALFGNMSQELYLSIPLFVLMASLLEHSGVASDLYETMHKWMAGLKGGLAMGTCIICALIDAMSGLGATATITMGVLALPEMLKRGYNKELAIGCIPCGGALGPLIPPSVAMIILGGLTGLSVGKLFIGGFIPGFLITFLFCIYIGIRCLINPKLGPPLPPEERGTWREKLISLRGVILAVLLVVTLMAAIYSGACTPTEAGGLGAFLTTLIILFRKRMTWKVLTTSLFATMKINAMVLWLLVAGTAFASLLNSLGIAEFLGGKIIGISGTPITVISVMMIISLLMGCFIDGSSILMICTPIFFPVIVKLGIDPLWFGVLFIISIVIGYVTPPFGMNLFYMKGLVPAGVTMKDIWRSVFPYTILMIVGLILCILFPKIITYLPSLMIA